MKAVSDFDDLMIINKSGILIRLAVSNLRVMGRATQGVRLINLRENDSIAAVARVEIDKETFEENETADGIDSQDSEENTNLSDENTNQSDQTTNNTEE